MTTGYCATFRCFRVNDKQPPSSLPKINVAASLASRVQHPRSAAVVQHHCRVGQFAEDQPSGPWSSRLQDGVPTPEARPTSHSFHCALAMTASAQGRETSPSFHCALAVLASAQRRDTRHVLTSLPCGHRDGVAFYVFPPGACTGACTDRMSRYETLSPLRLPLLFFLPQLTFYATGYSADLPPFAPW